MYDPWLMRAPGSSSLGGYDQETVPIDAFDLTDADTFYDDHRDQGPPLQQAYHHRYHHQHHSGSVLPPSDSSGSSHFYMDLTRFGSYPSTAAYSGTTLGDDYTTRSSALSSSAQATPIDLMTNYDNTNTSRNYDYSHYYNVDLTSPTPPTPIPRFQVFDLTCFIEDGPKLSPIQTPTNNYVYNSNSNSNSNANANANASANSNHNSNSNHNIAIRSDGSSSRNSRTATTHSTRGPWQRQRLARVDEQGEEAPPNDSTRPSMMYNLASPSQEYQSVVAATYCDYENFEYDYAMMAARKAAVSNQHYGSYKRQQEPARMMSPQQQRYVGGDCVLSEDSTIHVTDMSAGNESANDQKLVKFENNINNMINSSSYCSDEPAIDLFATDCIQLPTIGDTCNDRLFDSLCRGKQPADTSTVTPSVATNKKDDRDEIRSCGTLPPDDIPVILSDDVLVNNKETTNKKEETRNQNITRNNPNITKKNRLDKGLPPRSTTNKKNHSSQSIPKTHTPVKNKKTTHQKQDSTKKYNSARRNDKPPARSKDHRATGLESGYNKSREATEKKLKKAEKKSVKIVVEEPAYVSSDESSSRDSDVYTNKGYSVEYTLEHDDYQSSGSASYDSSSRTADSTSSTIIDRREWMCKFLTELFATQGDQCKALFYATSIAQRNGDAKNDGKNESPNKARQQRRTGSKAGYPKKFTALVDFTELKDFCNFVLSHLDFSEVVENIDHGVYDFHIEDFQEDVEICFEEAMDKYEDFLEHESKKWNSKYRKSDLAREPYSTQKRLMELREYAGDELLQQFETDFKMQLLDHVCHQINKRQQKIARLTL